MPKAKAPEAEWVQCLVRPDSAAGIGGYRRQCGQVYNLTEVINGRGRYSNTVRLPCCGVAVWWYDVDKLTRKLSPLEVHAVETGTGFVTEKGEAVMFGKRWAEEP